MQLEVGKLLKGSSLGAWQLKKEKRRGWKSVCHTILGNEKEEKAVPVLSTFEPHILWFSEIDDNHGVSF